jgi:tight adherence protein B
VGTIGPLGGDLRLLAGDLDGGVIDALQGWATRRPTAAVQLVAGGLSLGYSTGGITAAVVDSLADSIRLRLNGRDETAALATQATLSAVILAAAPLAFLLVGAAGGSSSSRFLLEQPAGRICLAAGIVLDGCSLLWMLRMVRTVDR